MRLALAGLLALFLGMGQASYADSHKCSCDKKCAEKCAKGEGKESCKCKACDCAKTGKCPHGKCHHEEQAEEKK